jgi:DNA-directed RNA polymerase specialized sigma24 family protein
MVEPAEIASRASMLLRAIAAGVPGAAEDYDTLIYPLIYRVVKHRGRLLASQAARGTGTDNLPVPVVPGCDLEWIAHDVAVHALTRAKATAKRFDETRGDGLMWAIRAASFSYIDVVRETYGTRRFLKMVPTEHEQLSELAEDAVTAADPALIIEQRHALDAALSALAYDERRVVLATSHYGLSYAETAELVFGDPGQVGRVDRVLRSARRKLIEAERKWQEQANIAP